MARYASSEDIVAIAGGFNQSIGVIPFCLPNVNPSTDIDDLTKFINGPTEAVQDDFSFYTCLFCPPVLGCCFTLCNMYLVEMGEYGFSLRSGVPHFYPPGRWFITSLLEEWIGKFNAGLDTITVGPVTISRVSQGQIGLATNNGQPEILLPGLHVRNNGAFKLKEYVSINSELINFGPIKIVTVRSGEVRVCYDQGKVCILHEGRYAINKGPFSVANLINTQQQNMRFTKHPVLLDGGIGLLVEGLLTFKVVNVELLIKELGERDLNHAIQDVTKAEISRVFAGIHLEQISSNIVDQVEPTPPTVLGVNGAKMEPTITDAIKGTFAEMSSTALAHSYEFSERSRICEQIIAYVKPMVEAWGIRLINFQLESTKIANERYASEYEQASLGMAKAKANLRSVDAENNIAIKQSQAAARSAVVQAEGLKNAKILEAQGAAEALRLESLSRNEAAKTMNNEFAREYALRGLQVQFAAKLRAKQLTVLPDNIVGQPIASNQLIGKG